MQLMFSFGLDRFADFAGVAGVAVHFKFKTPIEMEKEKNKIEIVCVCDLASSWNTGKITFNVQILHMTSSMFFFLFSLTSFTQT